MTQLQSSCCSPAGASHRSANADRRALLPSSTCSVSMEKVHYCERFTIDLELLDMLKFYTGFEISDQTGNALTQKEMTTLHYDRITSLQSQCLLPELPGGEDTPYHNKFLLELLVQISQVSRHERQISQIEQLNQMPLYPTEKIIWDQNIVPTEYYSGEGN
ncbi:intron-binding protein aquarius-like [Sinocyclocheilus grahami]|uniref:intron-binding protein aquarius-like n=1 Tax=Sinocyclocheilus grahami TaxID=75366 RepID=UPI0007AD04CB|nr:PREDICTED: intron-binding protein aquarius-like [Sinocyclocheilus grahami]